MSLTTELEELQKEKAQLKRKLQSVQEEARYLEKRLRVVEEKLVIHELEERVKAKREALEQLESKKMELEKRLKEPQRPPESSPSAVTVSMASTGIQKYEPPKERQEEPRKKADFSTRCPHFSDSKRKCNLTRRQISDFDYEQYCNSKPAFCYHFRKAESEINF